MTPRPAPSSPLPSSAITQPTLDALLALIPAEAATGCRALFSAEAERFRQAPGSRQAHQAWAGGYWDHIRETCAIAATVYPSLAACRPLPFTLGDAILVLALHDVEKPFVYGATPGHAVPTTKAERKAFREALLAQYGIPLSPAQRNALTYVEGEGDDYRPGERVMGELAAFCHMCDVLSARQWPDYPAPTDDPWAGAARGAAAAQAERFASGRGTEQTSAPDTTSSEPA